MVRGQDRDRGTTSVSAVPSQYTSFLHDFARFERFFLSASNVVAFRAKRSDRLPSVHSGAADLTCRTIPAMV